MSEYKKILTLCVVYQPGKVLLGMKKRGFGEGLWNGFGGKVVPGETIAEAAVRECQEEAGITPTSFTAKGVLTFHFSDTVVHEVHLFFVESFTGEPQETEEMKPQWFAVDDIPYDRMWVDDTYWLPRVLAGEALQGEFWFDATNSLLRYTVEEV